MIYYIFPVPILLSSAPICIITVVKDPIRIESHLGVYNGSVTPIMNFEAPRRYPNEGSSPMNVNRQRTACIPNAVIRSYWLSWSKVSGAHHVVRDPRSVYRVALANMIVQDWDFRHADPVYSTISPAKNSTVMTRIICIADGREANRGEVTTARHDVHWLCHFYQCNVLQKNA